MTNGFALNHDKILFINLLLLCKAPSKKKHFLTDVESTIGTFSIDTAAYGPCILEIETACVLS